MSMFLGEIVSSLTVLLLLCDEVNFSEELCCTNDDPSGKCYPYSNPGFDDTHKRSSGELA